MQKTTTHTKANYTGYGWEGRNYAYGKTTKECAAEIRKIVRQLWPIKEGYRIGVKYNSFSMGSSIDITIKAAPFKIFRPEYAAAYKVGKETRDWSQIHAMQEERRNCAGNDPMRGKSIEYTEEAEDLRQQLEKLGNSFRMDDSDGMIDYFHTNFYLHVTYDWQLDKES